MPSPLLQHVVAVLLAKPTNTDLNSYVGKWTWDPRVAATLPVMGILDPSLSSALSSLQSFETSKNRTHDNKNAFQGYTGGLDLWFFKSYSIICLAFPPSFFGLVYGLLKIYGSSKKIYLKAISMPLSCKMLKPDLCQIWVGLNRWASGPAHFRLLNIPSSSRLS